jgi:hypothetical protein
MRLYTVHSGILLIVLLLLTAYLGRAVYQKKICRFAAYYPVCVAAYAAALYVSYVSTFSYEESVRNATGYRYLSVIVLYGFFVLTGMMLHSFGTERGLHRSPEAEGRVHRSPEAEGGLHRSPEVEGEILCSSDMEGRGKALPEAETGIAGAADTGIHGNARWKMQAVLIAGLVALALCNVNSKILYLASEIQEWKLPQYPVIMETRGQIEKIQDVISEDDRVYLLSNKYDLDNMNEYLAFKKIICVGGSWMIKQDMIKHAQFEKITELSKETIKKMLDIRIDNMDVDNKIITVKVSNIDRFNYHMKKANKLIESIGDYKLTSMFIVTSICDWKCCRESNIPVSVCQNSDLATQPTLDYPIEKIYQRYINDGLTHAIVIGGLEPMMQEYEVLALIKYFRIHNCNDDIVIYTGYNEDEISQEFITEIKNYGNIVIKYGRYVPNSEKRYDDILGITLVSDNQYAKRY